MGVPSPDYYQVKKLNFGDYIQVYDISIRINMNTARILGVITLYPSGNAQGCWGFVVLLTGDRIHIY